MKAVKVLVLISVFAVIFFSTPTAKADEYQFGPFPDFKGWRYVGDYVPVPTITRKTIHIPFDGDFSINFPDIRYIWVTVPVPIIVPTYIKLIPTYPQIWNPMTDYLQVTDIYAYDLNPTGDPTTFLMKGFNPTTPEIHPVTNEIFIGGVSGTQYEATVNEMCTVGQLSYQLPGYDFSGFAGADPNSRVYYSQAMIPGWDAAPEPATLCLLTLGGLAVMRRGKR